MNIQFKNAIKKLLVVSLITVLFACGGKEERKAAYLEKGKAYLADKNYKKAKIEFKNVLQIDPKFAEAYYYMGLLEEKNKSVNKAYALYKKAVELDPSYIEPKIKLAEIYTVIGGDEYFTKAKDLLKEILASDSKNTKAKLIRQQIVYKEGNEEQALKEIEKLVAEDPLLDNGINLLSSAYLAKGEIDKAIDVLNKGIQADPTNLAMRSKKAAILFKEKRFDEAEKTLIDIINQDKTLFSSNLALSSFYAKRNMLDKAEAALRDGIKADSDDIRRSLVLIEFLMKRKSPDEALTELDKMISEKPDAFELYFAQAKIFTAKHENEKAKAVYKRIVNTSSSDEDKANANNLTALLLISENDTDAAKKLLDEMLNEYPGNNDALKLRSKIALLEKDYVSAINNLRTILKSQPGNTDVSKMLAQAHMALKEYGLAESVLKNATMVDGRDPEAFVNYAAFLISQKRNEDAEKVIEDARKINKTDYQLMDLALSFAGSRNDVEKLKSILDEMKKAHPDKVDVYIKRGQFYFATKDPGNALKEFNTALSKSRLPPEAIESLQKISSVYIAQGKPDEAIKFLKKRIAKNPKDLLSQFVLANVYASQKDFQSAKKYYKSAISINPKWPQPYLNLSSLYVREGQVSDAINVLKQATAAIDNDAKIYTTLASLYEKNEDFESARKIYEDLLRKTQTNMVALNNLAVILLDHSLEPGAAGKALEYAKKLNTTLNPAFVDTLAWAYAKSGDAAKAVEILKPIVKDKPKVAVFRYHLGYALYKMGDKAGAKENLEFAVNSKQKFAGKDDATKLLKSL